ncbi:MAG TPA: electron transfer flavoprotein subunit beta/FixA family protein [Dehalococcoidia bacterium]|nr:electron transfer flavoprotein subunit beta/FixA family protein [Dehalococcoidia bacterium]
MRIIVCAKEVLDPDAVNAYAQEGRLTIGEDGRSIAQTTIPTAINAYDEQCVEAALQLRDAGVECELIVVSAGQPPGDYLRRAAALGADEVALIPLDSAAVDPEVVARVLSAFVRSRGGADLVLCGRQASDDDQGVVPPVIGELLDLPCVTMARALDLVEGRQVQVTRVTPRGDEVVRCDLPAVITVSSEFGDPRFPKAAGMRNARRKKPTLVSVEELGVDAAALRPRVVLRRLDVPSTEGHCEFIDAEPAAAAARSLINRLEAEGVLPDR